ncbi:MAG TPA: DUF3152 domain-containing protein [Candidatus Saccharimonadales bacterium]
MTKRPYSQYRQIYHPAKKRRGVTKWRLAAYIAGGLISVFVVVNAALWVMYRNRTYPGTRIINTSVGSVAFDKLAARVNALQLLPKTLQLEYTADGQKQQATASLDNVGVIENAQRAATSAKAQRSWLPVLNLFRHPQLQAPISINKDTLNSAANNLAATFHKDPVDAALALNKTTVSIKAQINGWDLDQAKLGGAVLDALDRGRTTVTVPVTITPPKVTSNSLKATQQDLQQQLETTITFAYDGKTKQTTASDIASWLTATTTGYELSNVGVGNYLVSVGQSFGMHVKDIDQVTAATIAAIKGHKSTTMALSPQIAAKTYHYCTNVRGIDAANLTALKAKLASVYNDVRGWNIGGLINYEPATTGCDFTVWLSAASQMPTFGAICDVVWSCEAGNNTVVINYDRWMNGTDTWNAAHPGGAIEEYRAMAINHETGHQLGFGHPTCTTPGGPSPVMQQESINLHGCVFNAWPLPSELTMAKQMLGL